MTWGEIIVEALAVAIIGGVCVIAGTLLSAIIDNRQTRSKLAHTREILSKEHDGLKENAAICKETLSKEHDGLSKELGVINGTVAAIRDSQISEEGLRQSLDTRQQDLKTSLDSFVSEWTQTNAENEKVKSENSRLSAEVTRLSAELDRLSKENTELSGQVAALEQQSRKPRGKDRTER